MRNAGCSGIAVASTKWLAATSIRAAGPRDAAERLGPGRGIEARSSISRWKSSRCCRVREPVPRQSAPGCRGAPDCGTRRRGGAISTMRPGAHHRDAVGDVIDHREVVRDEQIGEPELFLQINQQVEDLRLDRNVERRDRLVADQQIGPQRQGAGDADALALSAGEAVRITVDDGARRDRRASPAPCTIRGAAACRRCRG